VKRYSKAKPEWATQNKGEKMKLASINRFKGKYIQVAYKHEGEIVSSIGFLEHVQRNKITIYSEKPTMKLETIDLDYIVTLSELEEKVMAQVQLHNKKPKKINVKVEPTSTKEQKMNVTMIDGGSRLYYPGCNPPKKWIENHPYNVTCFQCKRTFVDRSVFISHFEKKGSTCKLES
jgi:hypothetical protein